MDHIAAAPAGNGRAQGHGQRKIALVSMPWAPPHEPSLALGILKSCLTRSSIKAHIWHAAPELLQWLTPATYQFLADSWGLNEFLFSATLDRDFDKDQADCLMERLKLLAGSSRHLHYQDPERLLETVMTLREEIIPTWLDDLADRILNCQPALVGFTCLFDQTIASLALARKIKNRDIGVPVAFGGYALHGEPGRAIAKAFPFVDVIIQGDGEQAIVDLAMAAIDGEPLKQTETRGCEVRQMDRVRLSSSPEPDYDDWFATTRDISTSHKIDISSPVLPIEASRGCWWGQNSHCVFCGIDDETMRYRARDADETYSMLHGLRERYGDRRFRFSDYIMPKAYYSQLLPKLADARPRFTLQSEIKANHRPDRVKALADAGFVELQPGIESFSTGVLKGMKKGVRGIDNVSLLKLGYQNRIVIDYNILYGLPFDEARYYEDMLRIVPAIYHLAPPVSRNETVVTRFSPLQEYPERFGITTRAKHHRCYDMIFSSTFLAESGFDFDDYCYYFDRNFEYEPQMRLLYKQLSMQIDHWKEQHRSGDIYLGWQRHGDTITMRDTRYGPEQELILRGLSAAVYALVDAMPVSIEQINAALGESASSTSVMAALEDLSAQRVILCEDDFVLGLAVEQSVVDEHISSGWIRSWMCLQS